MKIIKRFGGSPVIRKLCVRRQPGNLIVTADNRVVPVQQLLSPPEGPETCCACSINLADITTLNLEFTQ